MNAITPVSGRAPVYLPLCPGQLWLMNEMRKFRHPGRATIEFVIKTKRPMNEKLLREAVLYIIRRFENLRVRIYELDGRWVQEVYPEAESKAYAAYDLTGHDRFTQLETLKQVCIRERDWLLPGMGNVIRILFFRLSAEEGRIWFCMHHIISDFVSLLMVSGDLMAAYNMLLQGKELGKEPCYDFRKWWYIVQGYIRDVLLPEELDYWISLPWERAAWLPTDYPEEFPDKRSIRDALDHKQLVDTYSNMTGRLDVSESSALIAAYGSELENLLIATCFLSLARTFSVDCLDLAISDSGRNILPPQYGVNGGRLLGFIAQTRALLLFRPGYEDMLLEIPEIMAQIKAIPGQGIGFNMLTDHIEDPTRKAAYAQLRKAPQIFFIHLGRTSMETSNDQYEVVHEDVGLGDYNPEIKNSLFECLTGISQGQLYVTLTYSKSYHRASTVNAALQLMMTALRNVLVDEPVC